jgi:succinate dehydrogenase cytochrome b subunit
MPDNLKTTLTGYVSYRGLGHFAFLMHRLSWLATIAFLTLHILTMSAVFFAPRLYDALNQMFSNPVIMAAEIIIAYFVVFHGVNGLRIAYIELFKPALWEKAPSLKAMTMVFVVAFVLWLPALGIMGYQLLKYGLGFFGGE